ncbi:phage portal protein [Enterobacter hormaechei]
MAGNPAVLSRFRARLRRERQEDQENWDTGYAGENAGKTAILSNGAKYVPGTVSAADAQTVEQLRMTAQIVCSVFHVPAIRLALVNCQRMTTSRCRISSITHSVFSP